MERKVEDDWVKRCMMMEVEGTRPRGRPKKMWMEVVADDMKRMRLTREDALDRQKWRKCIWGATGQPG